MHLQKYVKTLILSKISKNSMNTSATRDLYLDLIKYSLENESINNFISKLTTDDDITILIEGKIEELHYQDCNGKRVRDKMNRKYAIGKTMNMTNEMTTENKSK